MLDKTIPPSRALGSMLSAPERDPLPLPQWFGEFVTWAAPFLQRVLYVFFGITCTWRGPSWILIAAAIAIAIIALEALSTRKERA